MAVSAKNLGTQDIKLKVVLSGAKITIGKQQSGQGIVRLIKATQTRALTVLVNVGLNFYINLWIMDWVKL